MILNSTTDAKSYCTDLLADSQHAHMHKDTQDTEGNDDLFSVPSNTGERPLSVLAWHYTGATTVLLSAALCV